MESVYIAIFLLVFIAVMLIGLMLIDNDEDNV